MATQEKLEVKPSIKEVKGGPRGPKDLETTPTTARIMVRVLSSKGTTLWHHATSRIAPSPAPLRSMAERPSLQAGMASGVGWGGKLGGTHRMSQYVNLGKET
ncbi:hypothetical protein NDU88_002694 [Pleurodeles waltl]|uniref:Uncharacterized protein n=1 Tax=Pleurodeles waltl TaxID=8319 RepID=A0AAV7WPA9_PLEWA|nr:hypothetical protein NDU88_002694 [Pleurodeles waltl]